MTFRPRRPARCAHLTQISEEIELEVAVIRKRYADPQPRMFPVAVTFLVPEK
jgi:hypothetical protein